MICTKEKLSWCTLHRYRQGKTTSAIELTLSYETMRSICTKHDLDPIWGSAEASFPAFIDWVYRHRKNRDGLYAESGGLGINDLVILFDKDLTNTARLERESEANNVE